MLLYCVIDGHAPWMPKGSSYPPGSFLPIPAGPCLALQFHAANVGANLPSFLHSLAVVLLDGKMRPQY